MPNDESKETDQLKRIIQLLQTDGGKSALQRIIDQNDQIIKLLTPAPDTDITNLGGSISTPVKRNP